MMTKDSTRVFAFDLPGHGLTTYAPLWYHDAHVDGIISIQRVMKHFGWERVNYLGHSMGGIIGFIFASLFPQ
jgi:pimeloyl-ACP methyl ester carboxylesterase